MKSVSRVINREANVSDRLRAKVEAAIAALGYVPDTAARSLAGGRSFAIGILFDNPSPHYTMKVQNGAYRACRDHGYHLVVDTIHSTQDDLPEQLETLFRTSRVDGFILTPPISGSGVTMDMLEARGIPYVRIAPDGWPERAPAVAIDDAAAAHDLATHLITLGHRRFGIITGPANHIAAAARRSGFIAALDAHGLPAPRECYGGFDFEAAIDAGKAIMQGPDAPTAVFASNDDSAAGAMAGIAQLGLKVPDQVSVVGFDDSWIARSVWPQLTTIHQPIADMAERAAQLLIDAAARAPVETIWFDYHLVERSSAARAPD